MNRHNLHIRLSELEDIMTPMRHDIDTMNAQITLYTDEIAATPIDALGIRTNLYNKMNELYPKLQSAVSEFNTLRDEFISTEKALHPHLYLENDVKTDFEIASEQIAELTNQNLTIKDNMESLQDEIAELATKSVLLPRKDFANKKIVFEEMLTKLLASKDLQLQAQKNTSELFNIYKIHFPDEYSKFDTNGFVERISNDYKTAIERIDAEEIVFRNTIDALDEQLYIHPTYDSIDNFADSEALVAELPMDLSGIDM